MNIYDYLKWRGDLSFKADSFNEVDNVILSTLAYIDFQGIVPTDGTKVSLKEAIDTYFTKNKPSQEKLKAGYSDGAPLLALRAAETVRYKDLLLHNEKTINENRAPCQFSAMTYDIDKHTSYIAFRGTDDTLNGWQEDFEISYMETDAQKYAIEYLEANAKRFFHKYYVGGHSKGGNLAQYASMKCNDKTKKKILTIWSNDGPGISDELFSQSEYDSIKSRYEKIVPSFSIFGRMFDNTDSNVVVPSSETGIMQHRGDSWQVEGNRFVRIDKHNETSEKIMDEFNEFLNDVNLEQRKVFSEELFTALKESGFNTISDLKITDLQQLIKVLENLTGMDKEAKKVAARLIKILTDTIDDKVNEKVRKINPFKKKHD